MSVLEVLLQFLASLVVAIVTATVTVRLSLKRFRSERWWEKKLSAYERVIEAFHDVKKFASENIDSEIRGTTLSVERDDELRGQATRGRDAILRAADLGGFILSEDAVKILAKYEAESEYPKHQDSWFEYLDASWGVAHDYMKQFEVAARRDLKRGA